MYLKVERMRVDPTMHENERHYKDVERELVKANRMAALEQLTALISEEIKQPITASLINAQAATRWLVGNAPNVAEALQALNQIISSVNRSNEILNKVYASVARKPMRAEGVSLPQVIEEVLAVLDAEIRQGGVNVITALQDTLPLVSGDRLQLQQVVHNLITNAVDAMRKVDGGRQLAIVARQSDTGRVRLEISDTGPGIALADVEELFRPLLTKGSSGVGTGLLICNSIVEAHGGSLVVHRREDRGTTVAFELNLHRTRLHTGVEARDA
jgi:C4-dicarboxylate-specific signal transduction histidine kinase